MGINNVNATTMLFLFVLVLFVMMIIGISKERKESQDLRSKCTFNKAKINKNGRIIKTETKKIVNNNRIYCRIKIAFDDSYIYTKTFEYKEYKKENKEFNIPANIKELYEAEAMASHSKLFCNHCVDDIKQKNDDVDVFELTNDLLNTLYPNGKTSIEYTKKQLSYLLRGINPEDTICIFDYCAYLINAKNKEHQIMMMLRKFIDTKYEYKIDDIVIKNLITYCMLCVQGEQKSIDLSSDANYHQIFYMGK